MVFDNLKKSLLFILPTHGGEAGLILVALFLGLTMPVTVGQILWVNMVTAVTLALALAFEPAEPGVMPQPSHAPREPLITRPLALRIAYVSVLMALITLVFATEGLGWPSWAVIIGLGAAKFLAVEAEKAFWRHRGVRRL